MKFPLHVTLDLGGEWRMFHSPQNREITSFDGLTETFPALVPGNFELDLERNGVIADPFFGMNMAALRAWESHHVWYGRRFEARPVADCQPILRFEGLDCIAQIYLNGVLVGQSDNALIEHEFSLGDHLREGENELVVHFSPAVLHAKTFDYPVAVAAQRANFEALYLRKAPHCFGWDIMPRAVSAGIWRPVFLVFRPVERLETLYLRTVKADEQLAGQILHFRAHLENTNGVSVEVNGKCGDSKFELSHTILFEAGKIAFDIPNPQRWWPRGRGAQNLYEIEVALQRDGQIIDRATFKHGIRTVELERTSTTDSAGNGEFCFHVNGERVFILGFNHVPADAFHSRDRERLPGILELAEEIGCNAVRCWGGNVYEDDLFFEICDEKGILIWQDFALACAVYPQDAAFQGRIEVEARSVVRRLRQHPSLLLWAGDNECDQAYDWHQSGNPNGNVLTRHVLPRVLRDEDPSRPFLPSSPFIDDAAFAAGEQFLPENHLWGPRDDFKGDTYKNALCHFASEIGYHGCPSPTSIQRFISPEKMWPPGNDEWLLHASSPVPGVDLYDYRIELMSRQIRELFGEVPDNLQDFAFASQCVQAEAKKFFIEWFRSGKWRRTGIIWWNLMDGWPQFSDAVVDYYGEKKLAFEFIRRSQAPLLLTLGEAANWKHELLACNDTREDVEVVYRVREVGSEAPCCHGRGIAKADSVSVFDDLPALNGAKRFFVLEWESLLGCGRNHYLAGRAPFDLNLYRKWLEALRD